MHNAWKEDARARFWKRLVRQRAIANMQDVQYLQHLRCRNDLAKAAQKRFGHICEEHGTNIYKLIASAHGENWDAEDEEKNAFRMKNDCIVTQREKNHDNLDRTCPKSPCRGINQLQGIAQKGISLLEEGEGISLEGFENGKGSSEEEAPPSEKGSGSR